MITSGCQSRHAHYSRLAWHKVTLDDIFNYQNVLYQQFQSVQMSTVRDPNVMNNLVIDTLSTSAKQCIPERKLNRKRKSENSGNFIKRLNITGCTGMSPEILILHCISTMDLQKRNSGSINVKTANSLGRKPFKILIIPRVMIKKHSGINSVPDAIINLSTLQTLLTNDKAFRGADLVNSFAEHFRHFCLF